MLRPWLWLLSLRRNSFIHHEKTAPEIIEKVFGDHGFAVFSNNLSRGYPTLEYCVQYRESDMDFVCRLMEEYGISYYFKHSDGEHKLIMTDEMSTFEAIAGGSRWYLPTPRERHSDKDYFFSWSPARRFTSGKIKLDDYDFKKSDQDLALTENIDPPFDPGMLEVFDYPGRYVESGDGQKIAQAWRDMERLQRPSFQRRRRVRHLLSRSARHARGQERKRLRRRVSGVALRPSLRQPGLSQRRRRRAKIPYEGKYEFVKSDKTYAPPRLTPKAVVQRPADGQGGGRGRDRRRQIRTHPGALPLGPGSRTSRAAAASRRYGPASSGAASIRRASGWRPWCNSSRATRTSRWSIGCVYNDKHMPPYDLPGDKSISGVKSNSTPGGNGYNEFIFDDKDGSELVRLHAQKDLESVVENDESRNVKNDRKTEIGQNDTLNVIQVLKIDAGTKVEITCGGSKITMTPDKIKIESLAGGNRRNQLQERRRDVHARGGRRDGHQGKPGEDQQLTAAIGPGQTIRGAIAAGHDAKASVQHGAGLVRGLSDCAGRYGRAPVRPRLAGVPQGSVAGTDARRRHHLLRLSAAGAGRPSGGDTSA